MSAKSLFKARNLTKTYRRRKVVDDVDFHVEPGEIVGLLGPNGAGKTTVFKMSMGMVRPDKGGVELDGRPITNLPVGRSERQGRIARLLETLELASLRTSRAETLSGGERRRLEIARALLTEPKILLLDEPFAGVDPIAVADIQEIVKQLRERGISVLLTDHNVRETLAITDHSYIIFEGRILREGPSEQLVKDPVVRQVYLGEKFSMPELADREEG